MKKMRNVQPSFRVERWDTSLDYRTTLQHRYSLPEDGKVDVHDGTILLS